MRLAQVARAWAPLGQPWRALRGCFREGHDVRRRGGEAKECRAAIRRHLDRLRRNGGDAVRLLNEAIEAVGRRARTPRS